MQRLQSDLKIQFVTQEPFQWLSGFKRALGDCQLTVNNTIDLKLPTDVYMLMWANQEAVAFINNLKAVHYRPKTILWVRRYEYYSDWLYKIDFSKVDHVVFVNDYLAEGFRSRTGITPHVIYNSVEPSEWTYREREVGKKIAMVGWINQKKNIPLALQILNRLPGHSLHFAGGVQCPATMDYIFNLAVDLEIAKERLNFYGRIPHERMDQWLEDKDYLLSCAISEGCPNNVLEAMAKGIKPIIHRWPGAEQQFPKECLFCTPEEAVETAIWDFNYRSKEYRDLVETKFGPQNYEKIIELIR